MQEYDCLSFTYQGVEYTIHVGDKIHRLTITKLVRYSDGGITRKGFFAICDCGKVIGPRRIYQLVSGDSYSCGCYSRDIHSILCYDRNYKHGNACRNSRSNLYNIWAGMKSRITNPNRWDAKYYYGKELWPPWNSFSSFAVWAVNNGYKEGMSIERKNNDYGYTPWNCEFIDSFYQNSNKSSNVLLTFHEETHTITEWSRRLNISYDTIRRRLDEGLSFDEIIAYYKLGVER